MSKNVSDFLITAAIILFTLSLINTSIFADDASMGRTPEGVFPMQENDVIMEFESINIDLEENSVDCMFTFHNTGNKKTVLMGFPGKQENNNQDGLTQEANLELSNFKAYVGKTELTVKREKGIKPYNTNISDISQYSEWFTFNVPFEADETVTVYNKYDYKPLYYSSGQIVTGYVLRTGAFWKGPIGSAIVVFQLGNVKPYQILDFQPDGFRFERNQLIWEQKNFEPTYDLELNYNPYQYLIEIMQNASEESLAKCKQILADYNAIMQFAWDKSKVNEMVELYNNAIEDQDNVKALYIKSFFPEGKIPDVISSPVVSENQRSSKPAQKVNGNESMFIIYGISGIVLLGLLTVLIIIMRKKKL